MGLISLDIPMPRCCEECPCFSSDIYSCNASCRGYYETDQDALINEPWLNPLKVKTWETRAEWCPLIDSGPHVMTLEEVENALNTIVWVDIPTIINTENMYALIVAYSHKDKYVEIRYFNVVFLRDVSYDVYGKKIRFWNLRPTNEQREAVRWDDNKSDD